MSCICCFFDNEYQKGLKSGAKGLCFENELHDYKSLFMRELTSLETVKSCGCSLSLRITNEDMKEYILDVETALKEERVIDAACKTFEEAIEIYMSIRLDNYAEAIENARKMSALLSIENNLFASRPLFRARAKGSYDKAQIREYFHVPFNKRSFVPSQRFSVVEQPMLYLAGSVRTALAELNKKIDEVEVATFMPSYSWFHNFAGRNFIALRNEFDALFNEVLFGFFDIGSKLQFDDPYDSFCYKRLPIIMRETVLYQLMTYPNKKTGDTFIHSYALPQVLTEAWSNDASAGIIYQSTKSNLWNGIKPSSSLNKNICFFVPHESSCAYNENLLNKFSFTTHDTAITVSLEETENLLIDILALCKTKNEQGFNMTDWVLYCHNTQVHIEEAKTSDPAYFLTSEGLYENNLLYGLFVKLFEEAKKFKGRYPS